MRGRLYCDHYEDYGHALQDFNKMIEIDGDDGKPAHYAARGFFYQQHLEDHESALKDHVQSTQFSSDPYYRVNVANCLAAMDRRLEAIEFLDETIKQNPNYWYAYPYRGAYYLQLGREQEAWLNFEQALRLRPGNVFSLKRLVPLAIETGRIDEARVFLDELILVC